MGRQEGVGAGQGGRAQRRFLRTARTLAHLRGQRRTPKDRTRPSRRRTRFDTKATLTRMVLGHLRASFSSGTEAGVATWSWFASSRISRCHACRPRQSSPPSQTTSFGAVDATA